MKKLAFLSLCVFLFQSSLSRADVALGRSNALLRFVAQSQGLRKFALYLVMEDRCYRYLPQREARACGLSSNRTLENLDFDLVLNQNALSQESYVFVAFKKEFLGLLEDPGTLRYLEYLNQELNRFLTGDGRSNENLWDLSVKFFNSEKLAAKHLAVLFQDTSPRKLHLEWLLKKNIRGSSTYVDNVVLLDRVIDTVNFIMDTTDAEYRTLFYPAKVKKLVNRNIYHFYVPLYLALLNQESGLKNEHATFGPLMITLSYEFITAAPDLRYLFKDPDTISEQAVQDIFGGYTGGRLGLGLNFLSLEELSSAFKTSTARGVSTLLIFRR